MSKYLGSVLCQHHRDSAPSMAIYENEPAHGNPYKRYSYYCFSCHASGYLSEDEATELLEKREQTRILDVSRDIEDLDLPDREAREFLKSRKVSWRDALDYGIMQKGDCLFLPCYNFSRQPIGYQLRSLDPEHKPKIWSVPGANGKYPTHSWVYGYAGFFDSDWLYIVESILDGLSIWSRYGVPSVAVLGTNPHKEFFESINRNVSKEFPLKIVFDPDEAGESSSKLLLDKLKVLGYNVDIVKLSGRVWGVQLQSPIYAQ